MAKKSTRTRPSVAKKTRGKSTPKRRPVRKPRAGSLPKVRVRMYRQGLGDCFLITFDAGGNERHMMIDCGTLGATTTGVKLSDAVEDIEQVTGGHLHVLIATHEHWDHVAAFNQLALQTQLKKMTIDHVWLAWTEDPADPLAQKVAKTKKDLGVALAEAASALTSPAASKESKEMGEAVASVLGFFDDGALGAGQFGETVDKAMEFVRTGVGKKARYCRPGDGPFEESWLPGFRVFVLGPPRNEDALYNLGEHGSSELYSLAAGLRPAARLFARGQPARVLQAGDSTERREFTAEVPFDVRFRREADAAATREMFGGTYLAAGTEWRRVDEDWLHVASDLALQLDSATNNTSLALAIERVADGKVLLFPADAQQGSWLSWHDAKLQWKVTDGNATRTVRAADLLARAVFYKVGHHASHNATARGKGLELMEQETELTAFIPVDRAVALKRNPKGSWKMPALVLYRRLLEKCQGRVVRSDVGWAADPATAADKATEKDFAKMATAAEWKKWGKAQKAATHVTIDKKFVDYVLE